VYYRGAIAATRNQEERDASTTGFSPSVLLFDEPLSNLDASCARRGAWS
jgi:ABC-type sugar transport system ATPase subunit